MNIEIGQKFESWVVLKKAPRRGKCSYFLCRCECGTEREIYRSSLLRGLSKSCGRCGSRHFMTDSPEWKSWQGMRQRCDNPLHDAYTRYGGRGITYDPRWADFKAFFEDMGKRPSGTSLDRINNDVGYSKENCRWATQKEQASNRCTNISIEYGGESYPSISVLARKLGLKESTLRARIKYGRKLDMPCKGMELC
jgi:hypothetical protein